MKYEYLHFDGATFKRINKKKAEFIYNSGYVRIIPTYEVISGEPFIFTDIKKRSINGFESDIETDIQKYQYWIRAETNYTKKDSEILFYIPIKLIDAFTGEAPTKHTINPIETYDMDFFKFYDMKIPYDCTDY